MIDQIITRTISLIAVGYLHNAVFPIENSGVDNKIYRERVNRVNNVTLEV